MYVTILVFRLGLVGRNHGRLHEIADELVHLAVRAAHEKVEDLLGLLARERYPLAHAEVESVISP
jgi:hypothetical protein